MQNQTSIPQTITINLPTELFQHHYSGIAGLLDNAHLLTINQQADHYLNSGQISYLQSCIETSGSILGDVLTALSQTYINCPDSREFITENLLAFYAAEMGNLLPYLNQLNSDLTFKPK